VILALGVAIGFAGLWFVAFFTTGSPLSAQAATVIATIGGAMVGALASYLGRRHGDD
jgi:drug/metabolite transporter (DMT)-like permease